MKLILLPMVLFVVGCSTTPAVVYKTVTVEVPVPYCPSPPKVPSYTFMVDQLTEQDMTDPGKVGQSYKADMTYLRNVETIYKMILQQYATSSANFDEVQRRIQELSQENKTVSPDE